MGLICGVGNTSAEVWKSIIAGKSGVAKIATFDTSNFACQIAAEVRNFDPLNFIEKKEVKKRTVLREAKTRPPNGVITRIITRSRRQALDSLVSAKASRLGKNSISAPGPKHTSKKGSFRI